MAAVSLVDALPRAGLVEAADFVLLAPLADVLPVVWAAALVVLGAAFVDFEATAFAGAALVVGALAAPAFADAVLAAVVFVVLFVVGRFAGMCHLLSGPPVNDMMPVARPSGCHPVQVRMSDLLPGYHGPNPARCRSMEASPMESPSVPEASGSDKAAKRSWRGPLAGLALVLACVTIVLATVTIWVHEVAFNTDRFTALVTDGVADPAVIDPVSDRVS